MPSRKSPATTPRNGPTFRPCLEHLEDRTVLSGTTVPGVSVNFAVYSQHDILVQFRNQAAPQAVLAGTSIGAVLNPTIGLYDVHLSGSVTVDQALAVYRASAAVVSAEPDYSLTASSVPNDPQFSQEWNLNNTGQNGGTPGADIHAVSTWNVATTSPTLIAQMDTGVDYNHPDLYQSIWINQAEIPASRMNNLVDVNHDGYISFSDLNNPINQGPFKITDVNGDGRIDAADILAPMVLDSQGHDTGLGGWAYPGNTQDGDTAHPNDFIGWNFVNNTNDPFDDNGHGTQVAGVIGAQGNNGVGVAGIDWQAQILSAKFLDSSGSGYISDFITALNYAVAHGAKIANNSWTGAVNSQNLYQAIANAQSQGVIFVAAAGNNGTNNDITPEYPASFQLNNIISVAATDQNDNLASFSNFGPNSVSLAAPGVNILSTLPGKSYGSISGTSASVPEVTGVLALVWGQHPNWTYSQVINQVIATTDKVPGLANKLLSGGRLDAAAALGYQVSRIVPTITAASASGPQSNTLSTIRVTFNEAILPATFAPANAVLYGPSGQPIGVTAVIPVSGSGNTRFDILFPTQATGGTYFLQVSGSVTDGLGTPIAPYNTSFSLQPVFIFTSSQAMAIPQSSMWNVASLYVPQGLTIGQVQVQLNIAYGPASDLYIHLQAPDGTDILLANQRGTNGPGFQNTTFDDQAATPISAGTAPFTGSFQPEVPLGYLNGLNTLGYWKLWVENRGGRGSGALNSWTLTFTL
jgi:subtilisin family serine protease/subtilisin-like proprotein convertase family protein